LGTSYAAAAEGPTWEKRILPTGRLLLIRKLLVLLFVSITFLVSAPDSVEDELLSNDDVVIYFDRVLKPFGRLGLSFFLLV